jgi:transcription initiation factor TFIIIB Brf1 subunit/transcription initiation factor TFIIB
VIEKKMTVNKVPIPFDHTGLKCDLCGSNDIADEVQGYVCRDCGVVLTVQKLQYDRPYNNDILQYSIQFGATQIGTPRERIVHAHSYQLKRMSQHNSQLTSKELAETRATKEISRIFDCLSLPRACERRVIDKFNDIFPQLQSRSKYKNPEKLSAIIIYMILKLENIAIKRQDIVSTSMLSKEEFNNFILQIQQYIPEYTKRNRQDYIAQKLMEITEHFGLDMSFYFLSRKILAKLWENIKNTTDDVIAGLCTSITALCSYKDVISVSSICDLLNIRMSTIQLQVKKRIFERFRLPGFVSLVRSSDLLKGFMERVGLIEGEQLEVEVIQEEPDDSGENVVSIKLGSGHQIFNPHNEHYLIECVGDNKTITLCYLEVYSHHNHRGRRSTKKVGNNKGVWFDLTSSEYYPGKGPPLVNIT